ncbi:hypothetical protein M0804_000592 [Polistes exclamans]|nr:hypothetical protein M0804_000592 [Polistes exclamans]
MEGSSGVGNRVHASVSSLKYFWHLFPLSDRIHGMKKRKEKRALHQRLRIVRSAKGVNPVLADKSPAALTGHAKSPLIRGLISD